MPLPLTVDVDAGAEVGVGAAPEAVMSAVLSTGLPPTAHAVRSSA
jgi:hypothetical protein